MTLRPHQKAFLDQGDVLIIETRRYFILMWLTVPPRRCG